MALQSQNWYKLKEKEICSHKTVKVYVWFEVLTVVKVMFLWMVMLCGLAGRYQCCERIYRHHHQGWVISAWKPISHHNPEQQHCHNKSVICSIYHVNLLYVQYEGMFILPVAPNVLLPLCVDLVQGKYTFGFISSSIVVILWGLNDLTNVDDTGVLWGRN